MKTEKLQQIVDRLTQSKKKEEEKLQDSLTKLKQKYEADIRKTKEEAEKKIALLTPDINFYERLLKEQQKLEAVQREIDMRYMEYNSSKDEIQSVRTYKGAGENDIHTDEEEIQASIKQSII